MGFLVRRDGELEVKQKKRESTDERPEIPNLLALLREAENTYDLGSTFAKPDFFLPFPVMEGLSSATSL
jgi:hypothetical protein